MMADLDARDPRFVGCRSFAAEEVSDDELETLVAHTADPAYVLAWLRDLDAEYADIIVCDGDLTIEGDFDVELGALIVGGSLRVTGGYRDFHYPRTCVLVRGDLIAHDVFTGGHLEIGGNLRARRSLVGDYNDYGVRVAGDVETCVFYAEHHHFEVHGAFRARCAIGHRCRVSGGDHRAVTFVDTDAPVLREYFRPEVYHHDPAHHEFHLHATDVHKRFRRRQPVLLDGV